MAGFTIKPTEQLLKERGLNKGGKVQKFVDSECIRRMQPYTPFQTGNLIRSVILGTVIGSGILRYIAPYARKVYYDNAGRGKEGTSNGGLRGRKWFERMKTVWKETILRAAAKLSGAKPRRR